MQTIGDVVPENAVIFIDGGSGARKTHKDITDPSCHGNNR
jgi:hypothetical protein